MTMLGRTYEVAVDDAEGSDFLSIACMGCGYFTHEGHTDIHTVGPAEAHVLETGHHVRTYTKKERRTITRPFTDAERERHEAAKEYTTTTHSGTYPIESLTTTNAPGGNS